MKKNKKTIILVTAISITLIGILVLILSPNLNLLSKLRSSIIDPTTGDICIEDTNSSNIIHENGDTVKKILDELYAESNSTCSTGYKCDKPQLPTQVEPESCFTLPTTNIMYSKDNDTITVENALKELYTIYNSAGFCPQKYCNPITYTVSLDKNGGTTQGTSAVYEKYDTAVYLDQAETNEMTGSANPITKPTKVYTISYDGNSQGASYTGSPTSSAATFTGYFTAASGGTKMIDENGYIVASNFPNNKYSAAATLYAQYSNNTITLPAITKANSECKWAEGSSSGTQYAGGTSRTISGNITYYAKCVAYPTLTVENYTCNNQGGSCTKVKTDTFRKAAGTTETIAATTQSGYQTPSSRSVTYGTNSVLKFYHTAPTNITTISTVYSSSQLKAVHTSGHTDLYFPSSAGAYGYLVPPDHSSAIQWPRYVSTSSTSFPGWPNIIVLKDSGYQSNDYEAGFTGDSYSNGVRGTYFVTSCNASGNEESCAPVEELRPYFEIKYNLDGGSGDSSAQSKYAGQSLTLHSAPTKSGYTFKGWGAYNSGNELCRLCNGTNGACDKDSYYAAGRSLNGQEWNVGNESWPCASKECYVNGTNTVYLKAIWNRNPWSEVQ